MRIVAVLTVSLLAAAPATAAKPPTQDKGGYAVTSVRAPLQQAAGNRLTADPPYSVDAVPRRTLVPVADDLNLDIGMFSVTGAFLKDRGARGREPMVGTDGRQSRVAAVGFSLSF